MELEQIIHRVPIQVIAFALALLIIVCAVAVSQALPAGVDWYHTYRPATREIMSGHSPYGELEFYSPPWAAIPLLPFAVLPAEVGRGFVFVMTILVYAGGAIKLGARPMGVVLILLSPLTLHELLNANVDWLVLPALFMPARWGLFVALIKPQVGAGLVVFWGIEAWREGGWHKVISVFGPVVMVSLLSFALYGLWPLHMQNTQGYSFNASMFPYSIPLGGILLVFSVRKHNNRAALASSPMLAPYVLFHSWIGALIVLSNRTKVLATVVFILWLLVAFVATASQ